MGVRWVIEVAVVESIVIIALVDFNEVFAALLGEEERMRVVVKVSAVKASFAKARS